MRIDMQAHIGYNAGMNSIQYTIRSIPKPVDTELRRLADEWGVSLNEAAIRAFKMATGKTDEPVVYHDLDHLKGVGIGDEDSFNDAMKWTSSLKADRDFIL